MNRTLNHLLIAASLAALSACASLAPPGDLPPPPVPTVADYGEPGEQLSTLLGWREVFTDPRLQQLIAAALAGNRDLQAQLYDVERVRALYRIQRADRLPSVAGTGSYSAQRFGPSALTGANSALLASGDDDAEAVTFEQYSAQIGITAYELDLFGRVRSLSEQALQEYLATEAGARAAEIALITSVAETYVQLVADRELLSLAEETARSQQAALELTTLRLEGGVGTELDRQRALQTIERANADVAELTALVEQDVNALRLLVGEAEVQVGPDERLSSVALAADLPASVPSTVLLARPDIVAAEHDLLASNADIAAARAAFFPTISLTGSGGSTSATLNGLFGGGTGVWSFTPQISVPIFNGGALRAGLGRAEAERLAAQALYEGAIQTAFREAADALATRSTIEARVTATQRLAAAAAETYTLEADRYEAGVTDYFSVLDAQQEDYAAKQELVAVQLARAGSVISLFQALGSGTN